MSADRGVGPIVETLGKGYYVVAVDSSGVNVRVWGAFRSLRTAQSKVDVLHENGVANSYGALLVYRRTENMGKLTLVAG